MANNFNGQFIEAGDKPLVGAVLEGKVHAAKADKAGRKPGQLVGLKGDSTVFPFGYVMDDTSALKGILGLDVNYNENGEVVVGKTNAVIIEGTVCVEVTGSIVAGDKLKYTDGKFVKVADQDTAAAYAITNSFTAQTLDNKQVSAVYAVIG